MWKRRLIEINSILTNYTVQQNFNFYAIESIFLKKSERTLSTYDAHVDEVGKFENLLFWTGGVVHNYLWKRDVVLVSKKQMCSKSYIFSSTYPV